jgi:methyl-accepting chemotaxis protein
MSLIAYLTRTVLLAILGGAVLEFGACLLNDMSMAETMKFLLIVVPLAGLLGALISLGNYRQFIVPIGVLNEQIHESANGNLTARVDLEKCGRLKGIGESLNAMAEQWQQLVGQVHKASAQVASLSDHLSGSTQAVSQASNQVAASIVEVAEGAQEQSENFQRGSESLRGMSDSLVQMTERAGRVAGHARQMTEDAQNGSLLIGTVRDQMQSAHAAVGELAAVVEDLSTHAQDIGRSSVSSRRSLRRRICSP